MIRFEDIENKDLQSITVSFPGNTYVSANTNSGLLFCATKDIELVSVTISYNAKDTVGATFNIEKLLPGVAIGSGNTIFSFDLTLTTGLKNNWTKSLPDFGRVRLTNGDRLSYASANVGNLINSLVATVYYKPLGKGDYR